MAVLTRKIKGSTLLETLIAIVLILVCFSIATMVLVNIMQSDNGRQKLHAQLELEALYIKSLEEKDFISATIGYDDFKVEKNFEPYHDSPFLYLAKFTATSPAGQPLAEMKRLILIEKSVQ